MYGQRHEGSPSTWQLHWNDDSVSGPCHTHQATENQSAEDGDAVRCASGGSRVIDRSAVLVSRGVLKTNSRTTESYDVKRTVLKNCFPDEVEDWAQSASTDKIGRNSEERIQRIQDKACAHAHMRARMHATHATQRHATPLCTPRHATPRNATQRHAKPRNATPHNATPRHATPRTHAAYATHTHARAHARTHAGARVHRLHAWCF